MTSPDREEFSAYLEAVPQRLGCWRDGSLGVYSTLVWLNTHPIVVQREQMTSSGQERPSASTRGALLATTTEAEPRDGQSAERSWT